jgi:hypothetical protein
MFGMSLTKVLIFVLIVAAVWYGWKLWRRKDQIKREIETRLGIDAAARAKEGEIQDLKSCRVCGAYVAHACERKDCPLAT